MKAKILEIKARAEKQLAEWDYPNEHYIEAQGALMVCNELLKSLPDSKDEDLESLMTHDKETIAKWYLDLVKRSKVVTDEIEKAINDMIESKLHIKGFKEWMIEKGYDHNNSYTEFYIDQDGGVRAFTIDELFDHWNWKSKLVKKMSYSQIRNL